MNALVVIAVGAGLVLLGWRRARSLATSAEASARAAGETSYSQLGGARLNLFNATIPFARIVATPSRITLAVLGSQHTFERAQVRSLSRYRGLFSTGLRIEHFCEDAPSFVVFWTTNYSHLAQALQQLGYSVGG